ncbi:MAG: prepilin-type N-terminal cleavage/methylation domain-containing protein [Patescibacteria group bacterium]
MDATAASPASKAQGFTLVEVLSVFAILSVLATIVFFMFVANAVEGESDDGDNGAPHPILQSSDPSSPRQSYSPRIPH